eukprot:ANDGO_01525.mRNA.1 hypothetical protein
MKSMQDVLQHPVYLSLIFSGLHYRELASIALVCSSWNSAARTAVLRGIARRWDSVSSRGDEESSNYSHACTGSYAAIRVCEFGSGYDDEHAYELCAYASGTHASGQRLPPSIRSLLRSYTLFVGASNAQGSASTDCRDADHPAALMEGLTALTRLQVHVVGADASQARMPPLFNVCAALSCSCLRGLRSLCVALSEDCSPDLRLSDAIPALTTVRQTCSQLSSLTLAAPQLSRQDILHIASAPQSFLLLSCFRLSSSNTYSLDSDDPADHAAVLQLARMISRNTGFQKIAFHQIAFTRDAIQLLAESHLPFLRSFGLTAMHWNVQKAQALACSRWRTIEELHLTDAAGLYEDGLSVLFSCTMIRRLRVLTLSTRFWNVDPMLSAEYGLPTVDHANVHSLYAPMMSFGALSAIDLSGNDWFCSTVEAVSASTRLFSTHGFASRISKLGIANVGFSAQTLEIFLTNCSWDNVQHLDVSENDKMGDSVLDILSSCPFRKHLASLEMRGCGVSSAAFQAFVGVNNLPNLRMLDISANDLDCTGCAALARHSRNFPNLASLIMACSSIGEAGAWCLCGLKQLSYLDVSSNGVPASFRDAVMSSPTMLPLLEVALI